MPSRHLKHTSSRSSNRRRNLPAVFTFPAFQPPKRYRKQMPPSSPSESCIPSEKHLVTSTKVLNWQDRTSFPLKLHKMLGQTEADGLQDIVSWMPHGRCFVVHKPKLFVDVVMPRFFRQTKFASFQRQINIYGFHRITQGRDKNGYHHPKFLRGQHELSAEIFRVKIKGTGVRRPTCPKEEPNFYSMSAGPATVAANNEYTMHTSSYVPNPFSDGPVGRVVTPQTTPRDSPESPQQDRPAFLHTQNVVDVPSFANSPMLADRSHTRLSQQRPRIPEPIGQSSEGCPFLYRPEEEDRNGETTNSASLPDSLFCAVCSRVCQQCPDDPNVFYFEGMRVHYLSTEALRISLVEHISDTGRHVQSLQTN